MINENIEKITKDKKLYKNIESYINLKQKLNNKGDNSMENSSFSFSSIEEVKRFISFIKRCAGDLDFERALHLAKLKSFKKYIYDELTSTKDYNNKQQQQPQQQAPQQQAQQQVQQQQYEEIQEIEAARQKRLEIIKQEFGSEQTTEKDH